MYKVVAWVRDQDLEKTLNDVEKNGWLLREMFRNNPGGDGLETTTLVFDEPEWTKHEEHTDDADRYRVRTGCGTCVDSYVACGAAV